MNYGTDKKLQEVRGNTANPLLDFLNCCQKSNWAHKDQKVLTSKLNSEVADSVKVQALYTNT